MHWVSGRTVSPPLISSLTCENPPVTGNSSPSRTASPTVVSWEIAIAVTCPVEETCGPSLPIISAIMGVMRAVGSGVCGHCLTPAPPRCGATAVSPRPRQRGQIRATHTVSQGLHSGTLSWELSPGPMKKKQGQEDASQGEEFMSFHSALNKSEDQISGLQPLVWRLKHINKKRRLKGRKQNEIVPVLFRFCYKQAWALPNPLQNTFHICKMTFLANHKNTNLPLETWHV